MEAALAPASSCGSIVGATGLTALSGREVAGRVVVLRLIAERYSELVDPQNGPSGIRGDGGALSLLQHERGCRIRSSRPPRCSCALRSVVEFERLARRLRAEERGLWRHLDGWWLSASTRTMWHCPRCGLTHQREHVHGKRKGSGLIAIKCKRVIVWSRLPGARESGADRALEWMAVRWGLGHEPQLSEEIRIAEGRRRR